MALVITPTGPFLFSGPLVAQPRYSFLPACRLSKSSIHFLQRAWTSSRINYLIVMVMPPLFPSLSWYAPLKTFLLTSVAW